MRSKSKIHWKKWFVHIFCCLPDTDTTLVMSAWETQLSTLGNICAKFNKIWRVVTENFTGRNCLFTFSAVSLILMQLWWLGLALFQKYLLPIHYLRPTKPRNTICKFEEKNPGLWAIFQVKFCTYTPGQNLKTIWKIVKNLILCLIIINTLSQDVCKTKTKHTIKWRQHTKII